MKTLPYSPVASRSSNNRWVYKYRVIFIGQAQKWCVSLLLTFCSLELSYMATSNCLGDWKCHLAVCSRGGGEVGFVVFALFKCSSFPQIQGQHPSDRLPHHVEFSFANHHHTSFTLSHFLLDIYSL